MLVEVFYRKLARKFQKELQWCPGIDPRVEGYNKHVINQNAVRIDLTECAFVQTHECHKKCHKKIGNIKKKITKSVYILRRHVSNNMLSEYSLLSIKNKESMSLFTMLL